MAIDLSLSFATLGSGVRVNSTIAEPSGAAVGDFLLACLMLVQDITTSVTLPSGWTLIFRDDDAANPYLPGRVGSTIVSYIRRGASAPDLTWVHASTTTTGWVWRITGVVASGSPEDATRSTVYDDSNPMTTTSITTATADAAVIALRSKRQASTTGSSSTMTERLDISHLYVQADIQAVAGATGAKNVTDSAENDGEDFLIALKPAAADGDPEGRLIGGKLLHGGLLRAGVLVG